MYGAWGCWLVLLLGSDRGWVVTKFLERKGGFICWSQFLYIRAHNVLWNDVNNQLIDHSGSLLITFRNLGDGMVCVSTVVSLGDN